MFPHIRSVNELIYKLQANEGSNFEPFSINAAELGLIMLYVQQPEQREVILQLFRPYLTDKNYEQLTHSISFAVEREKITELLGRDQDMESSYVCNVNDVEKSLGATQ